MLINAEARLSSGLENLQGDVRADGLSSANSRRLMALVADCHDFDPDGQLWARAICLAAYAILMSGKVGEQRYRSLLHELARAADLQHPESMAARWILGRVKLGIAASGAVSESARALLVQEALRRFDQVTAVSLRHPILLPGVAVEYPSALFTDYDPRDIDPLVRQVFPPLRYRMATAAALVDCKPQEGSSMLDRAMADAIELRALHPDGIVAQLNGDVALAFSAALGTRSERQRSSLRAMGDRLQRRIEGVGAAHGAGPRKLLEWRAAVHAMNGIHSDTSAGMAGQFTEMETNLRSLFQEHYSRRLPDFVWVDGVYFRAYEKAMGKGREDYARFLRGLLPRVD